MKNLFLIIFCITPLFLYSQHKLEFQGVTYYEYKGISELNGKTWPEYHNHGFSRDPGYIKISENEIFVKFLSGDEMIINLSETNSTADRVIYNGITNKGDVAEINLVKNRAEIILGVKYSECTVEAYINPFKVKNTSAYEFMIVFWVIKGCKQNENVKIDKLANKESLNINDNIDKELELIKQKMIIDYYYFTDPRDSIKYKIVKTGDIHWFAENLNFKTDNGSWCYENKEINCEKYGRLYDLLTSKNVCPAGWHLPNVNEWESLEKFIGKNYAGLALKSINDWNENSNGLDILEFKALPSGYCNGSSFRDLGSYAYWWSSSQSSFSENFVFFVSKNTQFLHKASFGRLKGASIRCIKDE